MQDTTFNDKDYSIYVFSFENWLSKADILNPSFRYLTCIMNKIPNKRTAKKTANQWLHLIADECNKKLPGRYDVIEMKAPSAKSMFLHEDLVGFVRFKHDTEYETHVMILAKQTGQYDIQYNAAYPVPDTNTSAHRIIIGREYLP